MRWRAEIGGTVQSSPAVYDTTVYIGTYGVEGFRAFDSETGEPAWSADIGRTWGSPAIADGIVYIGSLAGRVYAFEAESGDELWTVDIGDLIKSSPAVVDGSLYIGSHNGRVYALSE
jgi:outer membrane protein assembly factor BamB